MNERNSAKFFRELSNRSRPDIAKIKHMYINSGESRIYNIEKFPPKSNLSTVIAISFLFPSGTRFSVQFDSLG